MGFLEVFHQVALFLLATFFVGQGSCGSSQCDDANVTNCLHDFLEPIDALFETTMTKQGPDREAMETACRLERLAAEDYVLGDTGIKVPKGCIIAVPIYSMHHDPEYFPDPFTFKPERFIGENIESIRPYTYLPFGAGPRSCIGNRFALEVMKIALLHVVRSVESYRSQNTPVRKIITGDLHLKSPKMHGIHYLGNYGLHLFRRH